MGKKRKYRVRVADLLPESVSHEAVFEQNSHFLVSLSNPNHYGKRLGAILQFLDRYFKEITLLTSGLLYRHNFMIVNGGDYEHALQTALAMEQTYIQEELGPYQHILEQDKFKVSRWSDHVVLDDWQHACREVKIFFESDAFFRSKLLKTAEIFLRESRYLKMHSDQTLDYLSDANIQHAMNFMLEESAMFNYLVKQGYPVCVYPGTFLPAINDILRGEHPEAPLGLQQRVYLEVEIFHCGGKVMKIQRSEVSEGEAEAKQPAIA